MIGWTQADLPDNGTGADEQQVFVAREAQISRLDDLLRQALDGKGQIVFVSGKAGTGKTSLLKQFLARVKETRPETLVCYSECHGTPLVGDPLRPFDDLLAEIEQEACNRSKLLKWRKWIQERQKRLIGRSKAEWKGLLGDVIGIFSPLISLAFKVASMILAALIGTKDDGAADESSFRQRYEHLASYAQRWPLVLTIDNFQRADDRTYALLEDTAARIRKLRVLLIVAFRPEDLSWDNPLYTLWNEMTVREGIPEIRLDELIEEEDEQRRFVDAYLDTAYRPNRFDAQLRREITRRTEGLPLFVRELLRLFQQQGWIRQVEGHWTQVARPDRRLPDTVERLIKQARWSKVEAKDQKRLQVASVEGETFTLQVVADAIEEDASKVCERFDGELGQRQQWIRSARPVRLTGHTYHRYGFWHSFYHEAAYDLLSPAAKKQWHGRVGKVKKTIWGAAWQDIATELVEHFELAEDWDEALACYEHILREWQGLAPPERLAQVTLKCADMLQRLERVEVALPRYQEAELLSVQANDPIQRRTALTGQAWTRFEMESYAEAERLFRSVLSFEASLEKSSGSEVVEKWPPLGRRLYFGQAVAQIANGEQEEGLTTLATALAPDAPETNDRIDEKDLLDARQWLRRLREQHPDTPGITEALKLVSFEPGEPI
ncbi:MAG: hypothetical protein FJ011_17390 [Chloroflexi bacterium]|nr:hypothetical protein [Chloroflexota bacterium]